MSKGIDELAREHAPRAIELLADTMETAVEDRDKIRAAEAILDRGYGKPAQAIIQVPANRRQAALLAGMTDEALVAIIEHKQLPRLGPRQPMITIASNTHGPADSFPEVDPLLQ
jgi:translation initiation factor IF-2